MLEDISNRAEVLNSEIKYYPKEDILRAKAVFTTLEHIEEAKAISREEIDNGTDRKDTTDTN